MVAEPQQGRRSAASLIAYGGPAVPLSVLLMPLYIYLPPFYAQEIGLGLTTIGAIFFFARSWDAFTDPLIGWLSDRTRTRWGRRRPWVAAATPVLMISTWFLLLPPAGADGLYLLFWFALFFLAWTAVQIPYQSWGTELSADYAGRNRIAAFRESGTMIGMLLATGLPLWLLGTDDLPYRQVLTIFAVTAVVLLPLTIAMACWFNPETAPAAVRPASLRDMVRALAGNRPLQLYLVAIAFAIGSLSVFDAVILLYMEHVVGLPGAYLGLVLVQYVLGIVFAPVAVLVANRISKHRTLALSLALILGSGLLFWFGGEGDYALVLTAFLLSGIGVAGVRVLPISIIAEVVDYGLWRTGREQTGSFVALYNLSYKLSAAFGVFLGLWLLERGGFNAQAANSAASLDMLRGATAVLPLLLGVPAMLILWRFPLGRRRQIAIRRRIAARAER